jgi:hypothetical protein
MGISAAGYAPVLGGRRLLRPSDNLWLSEPAPIVFVEMLLGPLA